LSFPIPILKALGNHNITIRQSICNKNLPETDFSEICNQSDTSFPPNDKALFVTDNHELFSIG
jgi:hypothetical protein